MNKNKKTNIFSNSTSLKLSFALCHGSLLPSFPEIAIFWATLICTVIMQAPDWPNPVSNYAQLTRAESEKWIPHKNLNCSGSPALEKFSWSLYCHI